MIDTRRYRWMIGIFGLVLVIVFSIYQFATHGVGHDRRPGRARSCTLRRAAGHIDLNGDANIESAVHAGQATTRGR